MAQATSGYPIIADESIRQYEDLVQLHDVYSGVNIKLMKCGGLFQAQKMLDFKVQNGEGTHFMKLIGCMSESTLGVSMAAVLASQSELVDLDAPYLNSNDPFVGFKISARKIVLEKEIVQKKEMLFL
ncbi:MAG: hypothetical protein OCD76_08425 [Reichenbachiella sp.]